MFKKLLIALSMLSLMACVTYYPYPQYEPKFDPSFDQHKYPRKPKSKEPSQYKISTEQMYQFILAENNMYSCLESQLGKQQEQRLKALEKQVLKELSYEQLVKVIGKEKAKTIYDDPQSFRYFQFKYQQLKHDISNIRERDCRLLTERYQYLWRRAKKTTELEESRDTSIQGRIQEQQESLERRIREQQDEMERRMKSPF